MYPSTFRSSKVKKAIAKRMDTKVVNEEIKWEVNIIKEGQFPFFLGLKSIALICHLNLRVTGEGFSFLNPKLRALFCQPV
jgi:hypothetical protein